MANDCVSRSDAELEWANGGKTAEHMLRWINTKAETRPACP